MTKRPASRTCWCGNRYARSVHRLVGSPVAHCSPIPCLICGDDQRERREGQGGTTVCRDFDACSAASHSAARATP